MTMTPEYIKNIHFSGLRLISIFLHLSKHNQSLSRCVLRSLNTLKTLRNNFNKDPKIVSKNHTHCYSLVCQWSILYSKQHDNAHKGSPICNEGNVVNVFLGFHNLVITRKFQPRRNRPCELPPYPISESQMASSTRAMNLLTCNLSKS
jgi:hypothetical protein